MNLVYNYFLFAATIKYSFLLHLTNGVSGINFRFQKCLHSYEFYLFKSHIQAVKNNLQKHAWCGNSDVLVWRCLFFYFSAPPKFLQPFLSDKNMPSELEYMIISFDEPHVYLRQWRDESMFQEIQFSSQADCKLLECRNVTMQSVVKPFKIWGQTAISSSTAGRLFDCTVMVDPILINFGQYAIHSLNTAIQAWQQVCRSNSEEKKCSYFD